MIDSEKDRQIQPLDKQMPDISVDTHASLQIPLDRVGMKNMELPVRLVLDGESVLVPARVDAFVSLDRLDARGIHMSRLYLEAKDHLSTKALTLSGVKAVVAQFLKTHQGLSRNASLTVNFELPVKRYALKSNEEGWRFYPIKIRALKTPELSKTYLEFTVLYSSTCPCSAALARQLVQEGFEKDFQNKTELQKSEVMNWLNSPASTRGVAHAQRSQALIKLELKDDCNDILSFIDQAEQALGTPVQSAVKRIDEQEFARLNAENLMFCEDASRKLGTCFQKNPKVLDFRIEVVHEESLHPHNAVAIVVKGIPGGLTAQ